MESFSSFFDSQSSSRNRWSYDCLKNFRQISPLVQTHLKQVIFERFDRDRSGLSSVLDLQYLLHFPTRVYGTLAAYAVCLTLVVQIAGALAWFLSSLFWIQIYRLGVASADNLTAKDADADLRNSFLNPATPVVRHPFSCNDVDQYDPANFLPLFGDRATDDVCRYVALQNSDISVGDCASAAKTSNPNSSKF